MLLLLLLQLAALVLAYDGTDLGSTMIKAVEHAPCVRLFHSTGSTGCRTPTHEGGLWVLCAVCCERSGQYENQSID